MSFGHPRDPCLLPRMGAHGAPGQPDATLEEDGGAPKRGRGIQQHATYSILFESAIVNTGSFPEGMGRRVDSRKGETLDETPMTFWQVTDGA